LVAMAEAKTTIAEYYSANNYLPADALVAGINTNPDTAIVASILYTSTNVTGLPLLAAQIKQAIIPNGTSDYSFALSGTTASGNRIIWVCKPLAYGTGNAAMAPKYLPANCRG
jgi:type IV pilus assembly protein PilA